MSRKHSHKYYAEIVMFLVSKLVRVLQVCVSSLGRKATYVYIVEVVSVQRCSFAMTADLQHTVNVGSLLSVQLHAAGSGVFVCTFRGSIYL